jgi:hypothetical protein
MLRVMPVSLKTYITTSVRNDDVSSQVLVTREPRAQAMRATGALSTESYGSTEYKELREHRT